jgi:toxin HigB-1
MNVPLHPSVLSGEEQGVGIADLREPPGNRLEQLKGGRKGQWSIRINDQWRNCFDWNDEEAHHVEIVDDH